MGKLKKSVTAGGELASEHDSKPGARRHSPERFSRRTTLLAVLVGVVVVTPLAAWALDFDFASGQVGATAVVAAGVIFLVAQLVRFRLRISLRLLLIVMAVISVALALVGRRVAESRSETNAVEQLKALGAQIVFESEVTTSASNSGDDHGASENAASENSAAWDGGQYLPAWLRDMLGESFFSRVAEIRLASSSFADQHVAALDGIRHVRKIYVAFSPLTAEGVAALPDIPGIEEITLDWSQVSADSVARLAKLPALRQVTVAYPNTILIAAALNPPPPRMELLADLGQVDSLQLRVASVEAERIAALARMPNLRTLSLSGHMASPPAGLLSGDASGLAELAKSKSIRSLEIALQEFSASELQALRELTSLQTLTIKFAELDPAAVEAFQAARPEVLVNVITHEVPTY